MIDTEFLESVKKMPLMKLPVRTTFVRVGTGNILISPGSVVSEDELRALSGVTDIVAPSFLHWAGVPRALSVFPRAKVWADAHLQKLHPEVKWTHNLSEATWNHQAELPVIEIKGIPKISEHVFVHKKSRSLIVTDLVFNMTKISGIGPFIILNLFGTYRRFAVSKFFLKFLEDKKAFEASLGEIFSYDFDNIILSHGENVIGDAKEKLAAACRERGFTV
jgi:hypothetical protein